MSECADGPLCELCPPRSVEEIAKERVIAFEAGRCDHDDWAFGYCFDCWVNFWADAFRVAAVGRRFTSPGFTVDPDA